MFYRNLLLFTLLTVMSTFHLVAQNQVHVHGTVTDVNGDPQDSVNILVSAFFADSTAVFHSLFTQQGTYSVDIESPGPNLFGVVEVSMVDCWGIVVTQHFTIFNGDEEILADFVYCEQITFDSCMVIILEEWNPFGILQLVAWIPPGLYADFTWSTGETTPTIFPSTSGTYCVTADFPWGCSLTDCIDVNVDSFNLCFAYILTTPDTIGTYTLEAVSFGSAPYTYAWSTGSSSSSISGVGPGTYCVTIIDADQCTYVACTIVDDINFCDVFISELPGGALVANGFGLPPVTYLWSTGDSTEVIYPSEPGVYCVTMADNNGCTATACQFYGFFQDSCFVFVHAFVEDSLGIALQAIGYTGAQSWSYLWNTGETTETIYIQDPSQDYCVTLTDSDGCESSACFESYYWCYAWIDLQYVDTATAVLTAYTDPIFLWPGSNTATYLWSNGDTTATLTVTEPGEYCVTVTVGQGCETEACVFVDFENLGSDCYAWVFQYVDNTGQLFAEVVAWGWGTFEYEWSNGDTTAIIPITPNQYACVTVTSSFGCETVACLDSLFLPCEAIISVNYISNNTAVLTATAWNNPGQGATFLWNTGESGPVITVNAEGIYCVTVMAGGCVRETCVEVVFWNVDSCGVWISSEFHPLGVAYSANAFGTSPFSYLWSNGDTNQVTIIDFGIHDLCVTVTDAVGCIASACNYPVDSCYVSLYYSNVPGPSIHLQINVPLAVVSWSTGDSLSWIEISEPGTYCATITTIYGCVATSCISIDSLTPNNGVNVISGYVFGDPMVVPNGLVYAYSVNSNTGKIFPARDSVQIGADGFYAMNNLPNGVYLVKAILTQGTPGADDYFPTYHVSSTTWNKADPYVLPNWLPVTTDIHLVRTTGMNGGGVIGGIITDPNNILAGEGDEIRGAAGLAGIVVLLMDVQGQALHYTLSLGDGSFRFSNLPFGTYRISYDIPGMNSPSVWVTLTPKNPEKLQVTLVVNTGTVAVEDPTVEVINLYPNPSRFEIHMQAPGKSEIYSVNLTDIQGRILYAGSVQQVNGVITVDTGSLAPGMYTVNLFDEQKLYYGRFIKQD